MGLPFGDDADDGSSKQADGCRTPPGRGAAGGPPAAPRKRKAEPGVVAQQRRSRDFYTGDDVEAFFAAHNL